jgi:AbrB family looped-hinge helix DNA binding protein
MAEMVEITRLDRFGRIVLPKNLREKLEADEGTILILIEHGRGQVLLRKLDVDELAARLEEELSGKDIDVIVEDVRREISEKLKAKYPDLLT